MCMCGRRQLECSNTTGFLMTNEKMLECFGNATVCVFAADYAEVSSGRYLSLAEVIDRYEGLGIRIRKTNSDSPFL